MRRSAVVVLAVLAFLPAQGEILTLAAAQEQLFRNNLDILTAEAELRKAGSELDEAHSTWWPSLDASASYSSLTRRNSLHMPHPAIPDSIISMTVGPYDRADFCLDISYPLFTGFSRHYAAAGRKESVASKGAALDAVKNRASLALGLLYFQWDLSHKQAALRKTLVEQLETCARQVAAQREAGTVLQSKLLDARARLQLAKVDLAAAADQTDSLRRELMSIILSKERSLVPDTAGATMLDTLPIPKAAKTERPEVIALDHASLQVEKMRRALRYRHFPSVSGVAGLRYGRPGLNMGLNRYMGWGAAGVQCRWNLFNGFRTHAEDALLQRQIDLINIERTRQIETIQRTFALAQRQVTGTADRLAACEAALEAAVALTADLKNSLAAGTVTAADYLDALVKQAQAELLVEQAKTLKKSAVLRMWFAAGRTIKY
ncbi:MAG: TolC family protein [Chitinispirillaceae bacterium]|nr:TolC family protein [Chitinispirillaceae bacterium]